MKHADIKLKIFSIWKSPGIIASDDFLMQLSSPPRPKALAISSPVSKKTSISATAKAGQERTGSADIND